MLGWATVRFVPIWLVKVRLYSDKLGTVVFGLVRSGTFRCGRCKVVCGLVCYGKVIQTN